MGAVRSCSEDLYVEGRGLMILKLSNSTTVLWELFIEDFHQISILASALYVSARRKRDGAPSSKHHELLKNSAFLVWRNPRVAPVLGIL